MMALIQIEIVFDSPPNSTLTIQTTIQPTVDRTPTAMHHYQSKLTVIHVLDHDH